MDNLFGNMRLFNPATVTQIAKAFVLLSVTSIISTPLLYYAIYPGFINLYSISENPPALIEYRTTVNRSYLDVLHDPKVPVGIKAMKGITPPILYRPTFKTIFDIFLYFIITVQGMKFLIRILNPRLMRRNRHELDVAAMKLLAIKAQRKAMKHRANELKAAKSYLSTYRTWFEIHRRHCDKVDEDDPRIYLFSGDSPLPESRFNSERIEDLHEDLMREEIRRRNVKIRCEKEKNHYLISCLKSLGKDLEVTELKDIEDKSEDGGDSQKEGVSSEVDLEELRAKIKNCMQHVNEWSTHSSDEEYEDEADEVATYNVIDFPLD